MNHLSNLLEIRQIPYDSTSKYFIHTVINPRPITIDTISIVMTSANRSKQVYYNLKTISNSQYKDVHIVIVDDSTDDPLKLEQLEKLQLYIDFIEIVKLNKIWQNPCVNYNIGFRYIKGSKIIIQNGEVCHVGDVLTYFKDNITFGDYYIFDVKPSANFDTNEQIYSNDILDIDIYNNNFYGTWWYQHHKYNNRRLHFLCGMTKETFNQIKGFSIDYSNVYWYDDDDFLFKIVTTGLNIKSIDHVSSKVGGIHLFHGTSCSGDSSIGKHLLTVKTNYYNTHKEYLEISDATDLEDLKKRQKCLYENIKYT